MVNLHSQSSSNLGHNIFSAFVQTISVSQSFLLYSFWALCQANYFLFQKTSKESNSNIDTDILYKSIMFLT